MKGKLFLEHQIDILYNFAYSIYDFFANGNFNMTRLKILDFEDLKRNLKKKKNIKNKTIRNKKSKNKRYTKRRKTFFYYKNKK